MKKKNVLTKKEKNDVKKDGNIWWQDSKRKRNSKKAVLISVLVVLVIALVGLGSFFLTQRANKSAQDADNMRKELELSKKSVQEQMDVLQKKLSEIQTKLDTAEKEKVAMENAKSTIEGSLSFPSSAVPEDMEICAQDIKDAKNKFCTKEHITDKKYKYGVGYKLEVTPGTYNVYATVSTWQGYQAFYNEFVTCGLKYNCTSHEPIDVKVEGGKDVSDIDPIDWYKQG